jgi:hypothetical protein
MKQPTLFQRAAAAGIALSCAAAAAVKSAPRQQAPAVLATEQIAVIHGRPYSPHASPGGDIALVSATGGAERPITRGRNFAGLASDGRRLACIGARRDDYNIYLLAPPFWNPEQVTRNGHFGERPCWLPGRNQLLVGREALNADAGDGGLWLVEAAKHASTRVLPPFDGDVPAHRAARLSPHGALAVAGGAMDFAMWTDALELRRMRRVRQPGMNGLVGVTDFAWLDDDHLLLTSTPTDDPIEHRPSSRGGIRQLSLRTGRFAGWWRYPSRLDVDQIYRAPRGDRFAIGLDDAHAPAAFPHMAKRILLIEARGRSGREVRIPGPSHACGFSPDGNRLLIMTVRTEGEETRADAYFVDPRTGNWSLLSRDVTDAIWM